MSLELSRLTLSEATPLLQSGEILPSDLLQSCLEQIKRNEGSVLAWAQVDPDQAMMTARLKDVSDKGGALYGIPFGVKDIIDTENHPTRHGSPIHHNHQSSRDAACVAMLMEAGAFCLGKTVTTELAHFHPGKTHNPHALTHTPGGSSSGSAAAVAACMAPFALGTQTTGSVLRPASYCGVFGFKPSYGDVSRSGVFECVASFDTVGWFTRSVSDTETVRRALLRHSAQPLEHTPVKTLRVGLFKSPDWHQAEDYTRDLIELAAEQLQSHVASMVEVTPIDGFADISAHHRTIAGYEFARAISWERTQRRHLLSPRLVQGRCADGLQTSYEDYVRAQDALAAQRLRFAEQMQNLDLLLTPSAPGEAWSGLGATGDPVFNAAWTALHVPALSVPAFTGPSGLPVGLQIVGKYRQDQALLSAALSVCQVLDVKVVHPHNV